MNCSEGRLRRMGVFTFAVVAIRKSPAAALVSSCAPLGIDMARSIREYTCVSVLVIAAYGWEPKRLHMSAGETDCEYGFLRVNCLREEVGGEREGAEVLEHGGGGQGGEFSRMYRDD